MNNWKQTTIDTYNNSATELAEYFRGIGSRVDDIENAIKLAGNPKNPTVLEIGCGDGRDAKEILKRTSYYTGFDISKELIKIAKADLPEANFEVADATEFDYGNERFDVVFAFASLLHLDKNEVKEVLKKSHASLKKGGIFYISLKLAKEYEERIQEDKFGKRVFYYYNPELIKSLTGSMFSVAGEDEGFVTKGNTKWFEIALRKK